MCKCWGRSANQHNLPGSGRSPGEAKEVNCFYSGSSMFHKSITLHQSLAVGLFVTAAIAGLTPAKPAQAVTCANFKTQEEATAYMQRTGETKLDRDRDGIACESLPSRRLTTQVTPIQTTPVNHYKVLSVGDGDTLRVTQGGNAAPLTIRLACIDAPEMSQGTYGPQASQRLKQLLPIGQVVSLKIGDTDRYGRKVAEVTRNGLNVNRQMVAEGQAVVYHQYLSTCSQAVQQQLLQAESAAKQQRLGFWQQTNPILPAVYRQTRG
jgi:endonuclease YncB( thermonuclease family)